MNVSVVLLVLAVLLFFISAFERWWGRPERPFFSTTLVAWGLFFWALSQLWNVLKW